jgi:uridine kinase
MKVALLISGYLRTFKTNVPNIQEKIINKFKNVDVYIHVTKNEGTDDRYLNKRNESDDIDYINKMLNPISLIHEPNISCSKNKKDNDLINTWLKYHKLNQLKKDNESKFGEYDLVIKYRPDLDLLSDNVFDSIIDDYVYIPRDSKIDRDKLRNSNDNYVCDIFAYGKSKTMDEYFSIYEKLESFIEKYGTVSETVLYHYLEDSEVPYKLVDIDYVVILSMCNVFAITGDSGSGKTTLANILKKYFSNSIMLECDRYHKWERGDENWKKLTHLNPEANYIAKMNDDIFDLKIGKDIYQVDYDHKDGKFTEKEHIESSDNIIVCGLHSLYVENETIYNLKIFIDTDKDLKNKWKIQRDVVERGYDIKKVLKQIEDRESDYLTYIYPQREKSDIVINFFNDDNDKLRLKLFISRKHNISDIINDLNEGIECVNYGEIFNEVIFTEYKNIDTGKMVLKLNDYYDYILYFIMNVGYNK